MIDQDYKPVIVERRNGQLGVSEVKNAPKYTETDMVWAFMGGALCAVCAALALLALS